MRRSALHHIVPASLTTTQLALQEAKTTTLHEQWGKQMKGVRMKGEICYSAWAQKQAPTTQGGTMMGGAGRRHTRWLVLHASLKHFVLLK